MDALAGVLAVAGVRGTIAATVNAAEPWGLTLDAIPAAAFHAVAEGPLGSASTAAATAPASGSRPATSSCCPAAPPTPWPAPPARPPSRGGALPLRRTWRPAVRSPWAPAPPRPGSCVLPNSRLRDDAPLHWGTISAEHHAQRSVPETPLTTQAPERLDGGPIVARPRLKFLGDREDLAGRGQVCRGVRRFG
jgi:hypothetical protein